MLFTIADNSMPIPSFRGLLLVGELAKDTEEVSVSLRYVNTETERYNGTAVDHVAGLLKDQLCFVHTSSHVLDELKLRGYKFYRCRDMDNGGRGI